ncbi:MAG: phasin family protein [Hyphomicrobiaceae bacterium]
MADKSNFEIPESMRAIAERNVEQAREACERFMDMAKKAQALSPKPSGTISSSAGRIQRQALDFAEENMEASFDFATRLAQASDMTEALMLQQEFAQEQMQTYIEQTQEMTKSITKFADKAKSNSKKK